MAKQRILYIDNYQDKFPSQQKWKYHMNVDSSYRKAIFNIDNYRNKFKRNSSRLEAGLSEQDIHEGHLYARSLSITESCDRVNE